MITFLEKLNSDPREKKWQKMCEFLEKKQIVFREAKDKVYYPDFGPIAESKEKLMSMNKAYMEAYRAMVEHRLELKKLYGED